MTLIEKLRAIENMKVGSLFPDWLGGSGGMNCGWGPPLSALCKEAADEIDRLRSENEIAKEAMKDFPAPIDDWSWMRKHPRFFELFNQRLGNWLRSELMREVS